jgi:hypothetical protein
MATMGARRLEVADDGSVRVGRRKLSATAWLILGVVRLIRWLMWSVPRAMARRGWRYRWHLAPLAGAWWVLTSGPVVPVLALGVLAATALLAVFGGKTRIRLGERLYLSQRERYALAEGAIGAAVWTAGEWVAEAFGTHLPFVFTAAVYAALTGHAAGVWWWSRRPAFLRREPKASKHYTGQWAAVAATGTALGSSYIRRDTIEVLRGHDITFRARLGDDHHAEDVGENERRAVERLIKGPGGADLPPGSVAIASLPSTVNEVQVTISPERAALTEPIDWPGVEPIPQDGRTVVSREPSGRPIEIQQFAPAGPCNVTATGGSKGGKTSTLRTFLLRGPATLNDRGQPIETIWTLDGGKGTSAPELAPAFDVYAIQPAWFPIVFEAWCAVHISREARRGDPRDARSSYRTWQEEDQILTLCLLEAPGVTRVLTPQHDRAFAEAMQRIRKLGLRVVLDTQEITRDNIPGGQWIETVRNQLFNNGVVLAHRIGTDDKRALMGSGDAQRLTKQQNALPPGGGWHIAMEEGQVLSARTRSLWAPEDRSAAEAQLITPRPLAGPDLEAAMRVPGFRELYEHRHDPTWTPSEPKSDDEALTTGPRAFQPVAGRRTDTAADRALRAITEAMAEHGKPIGKTEILKRSGIAAGSWQTAKDQLVAAEKIHQPEPGVWAPVFPGGTS